MPASVERTDPEGVDYGWVMQTTFVVTILVGSPIVAVLSLGTTLPTWSARAEFALRVGAVIWFLTATGAFAYAKKYRVEDEDPATAEDLAENADRASVDGDIADDDSST